MATDKPTCECGRSDKHEIWCRTDKPTVGLPACGSKYCGPGKTHAEGCDYIEPLDMGVSEEQPTGKLTDEQIKEIAQTFEHHGHRVDYPWFVPFARRIEVIVRKDSVKCECRGYKWCRGEHNATFCACCADKQYGKKARKDERERAAGIARMHYEFDEEASVCNRIADAILRGEDDTEAPRTYKSDYKGDLGD